MTTVTRRSKNGEPRERLLKLLRTLRDEPAGLKTAQMILGASGRTNGYNTTYTKQMLRRAQTRGLLTHQSTTNNRHTTWKLTPKGATFIERAGVGDTIGQRHAVIKNGAAAFYAAAVRPNPTQAHPVNGIVVEKYVDGALVTRVLV